MADLGVPFGVNNIIELARQLGNIGVMHTSTCYVAGYRTGRVYEDECDEGQDFRNSYEWSKCQAEKIVRAIPGVEFVDLAQPRVGYMCNALSVLPDYKRDVHAEQLPDAATLAAARRRSCSARCRSRSRR